MTSPTTRVATADTEAAAWHARLGVRSVSTQTIEEFFAWRADPVNADAYARVEKVWAASGRLGGDAQIEAALTEAMERRGARGAGDRVRRSLIGLAGVTGAVLVGVGAWAWMEGRSAYATGVGEQRVVQLADGSTVRLDTGSRIRVRYDGGERRVLLDRGQALFEVAHDSARPFVVDAGGTEVTAVGTVFDVRRMDADVRVTLVSGVVDVSLARVETKSRMQAGQQARVTPSGVRTQVVDAVSATSWTDGRLVFADTPLAEAVAEVNRYLEAPVVLGEGVNVRTPVNGVFRAGDRAAFASAAAAGLDLEEGVRADGSLLLSERKK